MADCGGKEVNFTEPEGGETPQWDIKSQRATRVSAETNTKTQR